MEPRLAFRFEQEHGHIDQVPHLVRCAAVKQIADETVAMGGHGNEIDALRVRDLDHFIRRFAEREEVIDGESLAAQFFSALREIGAVVLHFFAFRQVKPIVIARHPAVGDMHEQKLCAGQFRQKDT